MSDTEDIFPFDLWYLVFNFSYLHCILKSPFICIENMLKYTYHGFKNYIKYRQMRPSQNKVAKKNNANRWNFKETMMMVPSWTRTKMTFFCKLKIVTLNIFGICYVCRIYHVLKGVINIKIVETCFNTYQFWSLLLSYDFLYWLWLQNKTISTKDT